MYCVSFRVLVPNPIDNTRLFVNGSCKSDTRHKKGASFKVQTRDTLNFNFQTVEVIESVPTIRNDFKWVEFK